MGKKSPWITTIDKNGLKYLPNKKFFLAIYIPLSLVGIIGFILLAIGYSLPMLPLIITGWVLAAIGFIPLLILGIIFLYKNRILW